MRAIVPGYEDDPVIRQTVGHRHRLSRVAGVIANNEPDRLAEDAAGRVDVVHGHLGAARILLAKPGVLAGHGAGDGDQNLGPSQRRTQSHDHDTGEECCPSEDHNFPLSPISTGLATLGGRDIDEGRYLIVHDTPSDLW